MAANNSTRHSIPDPFHQLGNDHVEIEPEVGPDQTITTRPARRKRGRLRPSHRGPNQAVTARRCEIRNGLVCDSCASMADDLHGPHRCATEPTGPAPSRIHAIGARSLPQSLLRVNPLR